MEQNFKEKHSEANGAAPLPFSLSYIYRKSPEPLNSLLFMLYIVTEQEVILDFCKNVIKHSHFHITNSILGLEFTSVLHDST